MDVNGLQNLNVNQYERAGNCKRNLKIPDQALVWGIGFAVVKSTEPFLPTVIDRR